MLGLQPRSSPFGRTLPSFCQVSSYAKFVLFLAPNLIKAARKDFWVVGTSWTETEVIIVDTWVRMSATTGETVRPVSTNSDKSSASSTNPATRGGKPEAEDEAACRSALEALKDPKKPVASVFRSNILEQMVKKRGWPKSCRSEMWMISIRAKARMGKSPGNHDSPRCMYDEETKLSTKSENDERYHGHVCYLIIFFLGAKTCSDIAHTQACTNH